MKLASLETGIVLLPNDEPLAGFSENPNAKNPIVWLKLRTDDGIEGLGVTYFGGALTRTLRQAVDELGALVIGEDPLRVEATAQKLRDAAGSSGPAGILTMAMSAIDVALWDIKGKALGLPLWKLLGGGRDRIPTYASGALRRGLKLEEAATAAGRLRDKSYRQTKMQLGLPGVTSPAREVEQARLIREAVGPDMDLMCDINQRWRPEQAIDIGRRVEQAGVGLFWLEDVTAADDYPGLARVADALSTPVAGGEYLWGITPFRHMLEARSVDIVMIDQVRSAASRPGSRWPAWPRRSTCRSSATVSPRSTSTSSAPCRTASQSSTCRASSRSGKRCRNRRTACSTCPPLPAWASNSTKPRSRNTAPDG
jgi:L-talarate/galactarate dehydratase